MILLNKSDRFKSAIEKIPLTKCYSDVEASKANDAEYCVEYIKNKFKSAVTTGDLNRVQTYVTNATDGDIIHGVFSKIMLNIVKQGMSFI